MAFQVTLRDEFNQLGLTLSNDKTQLSFEDFSNYDDAIIEAGHIRADFSSYRAIYFTFPDASIKSFGSISGMTEVFSAASSLVDVFVYDHGSVISDGVYNVRLVSIPNHDVAEMYEADDDYVYDPGTALIYRCIQDTTGVELITNTLFWLPVVEADVSSKYQVSEDFAIVQSLTDCVEEAILDAVDKLTQIVCSDAALCKSPTFMKALKAIMVERAVTIKAEALEWSKVQTILDYANQLCCGC